MVMVDNSTELKLKRITIIDIFLFTTSTFPILFSSIIIRKKLINNTWNFNYFHYFLIKLAS